MSNTPTADEILERIDFEPVTSAIRAEPLVHWGYGDAAKVVWNVASRFLPADLERYEVCVGREVHWAMELRTSRLGRVNSVYLGSDADVEIAGYASDRCMVHGYTDLLMMLPDLKTAGELDKAWRDRLTDSWQWRIYCAVHEAAAFTYRGIEKSSLDPKIPGQPYDWGKAVMKEMRYVPSASNSLDVSKQLATTFEMRDALEARYPFGPWPRRMPDACRSFGQRCAYWDVCRDAAPMPEGVYQSKALSFSGASKFLNCPEHYRLATLTGYREPSLATELGNAVHRGTAALYAQFNDLRRFFYGQATDTSNETSEAICGRGAAEQAAGAPAGPE